MLLKKLLLGITLSAVTTLNAQAAGFWVTGKINRTLVDKYYGGAMIYLDRAIGNDCPSRWVSLDTQGKYYSKEEGRNKLLSAMTAFGLDKTVSLYVYNTQKHNGYCVVRRIDIRK
jgi:hypothetical protein